MTVMKWNDNYRVYGIFLSPDKCNRLAYINRSFNDDYELKEKLFSLENCFLLRAPQRDRLQDGIRRTE